MTDNYRPVMNSSNLLKLFEYCILPNLQRSLKIDNHQFGFRKHVGCLTACTVLKETILSYNEAQSNVHCAFLDLSKAFDKVNHNILLAKLVENKVPKHLIKIIEFMNDNQFVSVAFNGCSGGEWKVCNGVRQGGILSTLIFNFYVNDVLSIIADLHVGCCIDMYKTNIIGYADDMVLISPSVKGLQILLNEFFTMMSKLCLKVNASKSFYMIFKARRYRRYVVSANVFLNGALLKIANETKYLGVIMTSDLNNSKDKLRCANSFLKQFNSMYHKFSFVNRKMLVFLFQSHCMSFYGSEIWYNEDKSKLTSEGLAVSYHKAIKRIMGLMPWDSNHTACEQAGLPIFKHFIFKKRLAFLHSIINCRSPCLLQLKSHFKYSSYILKNVQTIFSDVYNVHDILANDLNALYARIDFVQRSEERSHYIPVLNI